MEERLENEEKTNGGEFLTNSLRLWKNFFFFQRKEILFNCAIRGYNFRRESTSGTSLIFLMLNERSTVIDEHQALCLVYLNISLENRESFKRELRGM